MTERWSSRALADGSTQVKHDWYDPRNLGWLDIHGALENSCNIYFWNVALGTYVAYPQGSANENILQEWASRVGYGHETGIDLTSEAPGIIPTRQLFEEWKTYQLENPDEPPRLEPTRLELASPWLGGDLMDFAIGQGAFTATPLQVASSFAVLVNGGTVMEPRVVRETIDGEGNVTRSSAPSRPQLRSIRPRGPRCSLIWARSSTAGRPPPRSMTSARVWRISAGRPELPRCRQHRTTTLGSSGSFLSITQSM